jgi:hypothetical protein
MIKPVIAVLGIDLGKTSFSLAGLDAAGNVVIRKRMKREGLVALCLSFPPASSPWRLAAGRTSSDGHSLIWVTRFV